MALHRGLRWICRDSSVTPTWPLYEVWFLGLEMAFLCSPDLSCLLELQKTLILCFTHSFENSDTIFLSLRSHLPDELGHSKVCKGLEGTLGTINSTLAALPESDIGAGLWLLEPSPWLLPSCCFLDVLYFLCSFVPFLLSSFVNWWFSTVVYLIPFSLSCVYLPKGKGIYFIYIKEASKPPFEASLIYIKQSMLSC